jgi:hypothetical protein
MLDGVDLFQVEYLPVGLVELVLTHLPDQSLLPMQF